MAQANSPEGLLNLHLTIGIGGPSSAGKTTLANALAFAMRSAIDLLGKHATGTGLLDLEASAVNLINQDDFFVSSDQQDWPMMGPVSSSAVITTPPENQAAAQQQHPIVGIDRDCIECVCFVELEKELRRSPACYDWIQWPNEKDEFLAQHEDLADSIRTVVQLIALNLLYHCPLFASRRSSDRPMPLPSCQITIVKGNLILAQLPEKDKQLLPHSKEGEEDACAFRELVEATRSAQARVRDELDMRFFLPVSKETARLRRFSRPEYQDRSPTNVLGRAHEQHWRQDGYFEHAWKRYESYHSELLRHGDGARLSTKNGVCVLDSSSLAKNLELAGSTIVEKMDSMMRGN